MFMLLSIYDFF